MKCMGIGTLIKDPQIKELTFNEKIVKMSQFGLVCEEKRSDSSITDENVFLFTIWDSAAEYLVKYAKRGDVIFYEATPKIHKFIEDDKQHVSITFRINKFKILHTIS